MMNSLDLIKQTMESYVMFAEELESKGVGTSEKEKELLKVARQIIANPILGFGLIELAAVLTLSLKNGIEVPKFEVTEKDVEKIRKAREHRQMEELARGNTSTMVPDNGRVQ